MKRLSKILLCLVLCMTLASCNSKKGSEEFSTFTKTLPAVFFQHQALEINFLFKDPETFGIKKDLYTLDFITLEDYKEYRNKVSDIIDEVDDYDYDALTEDQKITYDLLKAQDDATDMDDETAYYLTTNYFDIQSGIQAQLPMTLWNYKLHNQTSLDSFLATLNQAPDLFKQYTDLEITRQEKGFGMSQMIMDDVISSIHTIATTDQSYILTAINERIDNAEFVADDKKQSYKDEIKKAFDEKFIPAFAQAEKDLASIEIKTTGDGALSDYQGGKEYYESIVLDATGLDTMDDYMKLLDSAENDVQGDLFSIMKNNPELLGVLSNSEKLMESLTNLQYTTLTSTKDVISYLEEKISTGETFPAIKKLEYEMNIFPAAMKETSAAAAAYFISAFDDLSGTGESMLLNGEYDQSTFTTLAHESFPGHMYQNYYFKTVEHDILRSILQNTGYSEGWATYVEDQVCDFSDNPGLCHVMSANDRLTYAFVLRLDKKIHYDGVSKEEICKEMMDTFGLSEEAAQAQYKQLVELPGIFSNYYASLYRILQLQEKAEAAWKDDYSQLRFNKAILDLGPLPLDLLEKYLDL